MGMCICEKSEQVRGLAVGGVSGRWLYVIFLADSVISKNRTERKRRTESMGEHGRYHHSLAGVVQVPDRNAILSFFLPWELVLLLSKPQKIATEWE